MKKNAKVSEGYKKIIFGFVVVTVILVIVVLYFSASRAIIRVAAQSTTIETDFVSDVATDGGMSSASALQGVLFETEVMAEEVGESTGQAVVQGDSIGKVKLINKRSENQTLVKTTRLQTSDGILLRLVERVDIPANGELEAFVYADDPDSFKELEPTSFIIPGLFENLQKLVYGESSTVLKSTGQSVKAVQEVDIITAKEILDRKLVDKAMTEFKVQLPNDSYQIIEIKSQLLDEELSDEIGDATDQFSISQKKKVVLLAINREDVLQLAGERLGNVVPSGKELVTVNLDNFTYSVQSFDDASKSGVIKAHLEGEVKIQNNSEIFDKDKIGGLSPKGVELYLANFEEVEEVTVELSPFWVKKVPKFRDHIEIVIE
ncbi:hypothetical protein HN958_03430 [Candidatus Falkowbacteria bacterium]|nr:hypothetical protein [Candidatus Falkowbacteria bacterium]MBT7007529.1 hypothetical protein [Candidatus Falkowbacteria bacterium]